MSSNGNLVLTAETRRQCLNITVVNDDIQEPTETAIFTPMPSFARYNVQGGSVTVLVLDSGESWRKVFDG